MASDLTRGSFSGKETFLYYNSASHASQTWVEISRARNIQTNRGPALTEVEFHGAAETGNIPGYLKFAGSFEYVRKLGADTVWDALVAARDAGSILELAHLNGPIDEDASKGWECPVLLGEFSEPANGNDGVVVTIPFAKADAFDASGDPVNYAALSGSSS
ncbi:hypothetical protein [Aporhodopirellula aestuarii]|uniref:Uncharacterized protein n=1 Tax=Aporhodopirellula aestuarii TaxID=2950107 RepID=A0ABT0TYG6_9BACT|nr:hypothetical protein [Aporhodopirellula aestuarii]MCM2369644.1 hypothetical protein [Aporhodopirellula aestuarii]